VILDRDRFSNYSQFDFSFEVAFKEGSLSNDDEVVVWYGGRSSKEMSYPFKLSNIPTDESKALATTIKP
jgi:hypothetical protein